jgi:hypothetical protein
MMLPSSPRSLFWNMWNANCSVQRTAGLAWPGCPRPSSIHAFLAHNSSFELSPPRKFQPLINGEIREDEGMMEEEEAGITPPHYSKGSRRGPPPPRRGPRSIREEREANLKLKRDRKVHGPHADQRAADSLDPKNRGPVRVGAALRSRG